MTVIKPPFGASLDEVTDYLLALAKSSEWEPGTRGPTLDELNTAFFGEDASPRPGRAAYAPLIEAGVVEARKGAAGGHYLRASTAAPTVDLTPEVSAVQEAVEALTAATAELAARRLHVVELQDLRTPSQHRSGPATFGQSLHTSRLAAEAFAVDYLTRLGEEERHARAAAALAGFAAADSSADWGIRIYAVDLNGKVVDTSRRAAIAGTTATG